MDFDTHMNTSSEERDHTARRQLGSISLFEISQPGTMVENPPMPHLVLVEALSTFGDTLVDNGYGRFSRFVREGDLFLAASDRPTSAQIERRSRLRIVSLPSLSVESSILCDQRLHEALFKSTLRSSWVSTLLTSIWRDADAEQTFSGLASDYLEHLILSDLARPVSPELAEARGGLASWQIKRTIEYMHAHLADDIRLLELASLARLSPFHFARAFKKSTGMAPHAFQIHLRMERARHLLAAGEPVQRVAYAVGYETTQSFSATFKKHIGTTPGLFRRSNDSSNMARDAAERGKA